MPDIRKTLNSCVRITWLHVPETKNGIKTISGLLDILDLEINHWGPGVGRMWGGATVLLIDELAHTLLKAEKKSTQATTLEG